VTPWTVRPAAPDDLDGVIETFLQCWRVNYAAVLGLHLAARMDEARARALWEPLLGESGPGTGSNEAALVAVRSADEPASHEPGFPTVGGITRFELVNESTAEVHSLYVSPRVQGGGLGRLLLSAACDSARGRGATQARLWVFRENLPSLSFYRAQGWSLDGTERVQPEFGEPELRLTKTLRLTKAPSEPGGHTVRRSP
jgi:GNAT superfamily N-acetyltransferase